MATKPKQQPLDPKKPLAQQPRTMHADVPVQPKPKTTKPKGATQ